MLNLEEAIKNYQGNYLIEIELEETSQKDFKHNPIAEYQVFFLSIKNLQRRTLQTGVWKPFLTNWLKLFWVEQLAAKYYSIENYSYI